MTRARRTLIALLAAVAAGALAPAAASAQEQFFAPFGAANVTANARGVAVDEQGFVYVADGTNGIVKFNNTGGFIETLTGPAGTAIHAPTDVDVDSDGNIYVSSASEKKVQKYNPSGGLLLDLGVFEDPTGVTVDSTGHIYVTDGADDIVVKFSPAGGLVNVWGRPGGGAGSGPGEFDGPYDVEVDPSGDILVTDTHNNRVQRLSSAGSFKSQITGLNGPTGIAHDLTQHTWVSDTGAHVVREYDETGALVQTIGAAGTGTGEFTSAFGIAVDCVQNKFIVDAQAAGARVQTYGPAPRQSPPCSAPTNTRAPQVVGEAAIGSGLALDPGTWAGTPIPSLTYRWQRCPTTTPATCGDIPGQHGLTYVVTTADAGYYLRASVTATNDQGQLSVGSNLTSQVPQPPPTPPPPGPPDDGGGGQPNPPGPPPPNPDPGKPEVKRTGVATFDVHCPVTGQISCKVRADAFGRGPKANGDRGGKRRTLARVHGSVKSGETAEFTLKLRKFVRQAIRRKRFRVQALSRVDVDGERIETNRVRINERTLPAFDR